MVEILVLMGNYIVSDARLFLFWSYCQIEYANY